MKKNNIGIIGLAVMGSNLALNIADHGYDVALYNRTTSVGEDFMAKNPHENLHLYRELSDFVASLEAPRKIILMVQAGTAVDKVIEQLIVLLDKNDIIMDGGNSNYQDTIRRNLAMSELGLRYLGVGISGGEEGARFGPAIMPGGDKSAYDEVESILDAIAAKAQKEACSAYIGANGAGHYVKMVHNGIEYADMQLIAESYALLKHVAGLDNAALADVFSSWNKGELESFLIEITADIFKTKDPDSDHDLIDVILDRAGQKGTGRWTAEEALRTGTDASLLASAVFSRFMSSEKEARIETAKVFPQEENKVSQTPSDELIEAIRQALYASKIIAYAQGFELLRNAAKDYDWNLAYGEIAKIFRAGCIIRAQFLNKITDAYTHNPELKNLMLDPYFAETLVKYQASLRRITQLAIEHGIAVSAFVNAISYFDAYRNPHSPANLIQAQRDYFGSHTFERVDKDGHFHFDWISEHGKK